MTGERAVVRVGSEDGGDPERSVVDLYVRPGGAVAGEHVHERIAGPGESADVPPGTPHDWWNAGEETAHVEVEVRGPTASRFEEMLITVFGLAHEGKTNSEGRPRLLQLAVIARDYREVISFTKPPAFLQAALFGPLAAIGRARGLRSSYPHHRALVVTEEAPAAG